MARLVARGADPEARDARGVTPRDRARELWQTRRADSQAILALLPAGDVPGIGDRVEHAQFGRGLVEHSHGEGEARKLAIEFPGGYRTLPAREVRRVD